MFFILAGVSQPLRLQSRQGLAVLNPLLFGSVDPSPGDLFSYAQEYPRVKACGPAHGSFWLGPRRVAQYDLAIPCGHSHYKMLLVQLRYRAEI